jgi:spermidine synthase
MIPRNRIGTALIPGTAIELQLYQSGELFSIKSPGRGDLMNSRMHGSEQALNRTLHRGAENVVIQVGHQG